MTEAITRHEARLKGVQIYYNGSACCAGHHTGRYTSSGQCVTCSADRYRNNRGKFQAAARRHHYKKYGLTPEQADALRAAAVTCPGCGESLDDKASHIDHCHTTGRVRGILCGPCNQTLGLVKDNPETLERLISYLKNSPVGGDRQ